jgi:8-oxo-dGTP diphosphatase
VTRPSVALAVIGRDGRVLMTKRRFREGAFAWGFPSGQIEPGETPEEAAVREAREELALTVTAESVLGERTPAATGRHLIYVACRIVAGEPVLVDHEELAGFDWLTLAEADELAAAQGGIFEPVRDYLVRLAATPADG